MIKKIEDSHADVEDWARSDYVIQKGSPSLSERLSHGGGRTAGRSSVTLSVENMTFSTLFVFLTEHQMLNFSPIT